MADRRTTSGLSVLILVVGGVVLSATGSAAAATGQYRFDAASQQCCIELYQPAQTTTFGDVVAIAPDDAGVVGTERTTWSRTSTQHWDGREWVLVDTADCPFSTNRLSAVTAPAPDFVLAGGVYDAPASERCLTLLWDGTQWTWINRHRASTRHGAVLESLPR